LLVSNRSPRYSLWETCFKFIRAPDREAESNEYLGSGQLIYWKWIGNNQIGKSPVLNQNQIVYLYINWCVQVQYINSVGYGDITGGASAQASEVRTTRNTKPKYTATLAPRHPFYCLPRIT